MNKERRIAILSANKYSAYSSSVLYHALENNIKVEFVIVKKISGFNRIYKELKKEKLNLFVKIFKKIILQRLISVGYKSDLLDGFSSYFHENCPKNSTLLQLANRYNIPIIETEDFHSKEILTKVNQSQLDIIVFTGGGLIRNELIKLPKIGILNCHMGILPFYRGMDCTYWALLNKDHDKIGFTTHLMDVGVDTGNIIKKYYISNNFGKNPDLILKAIEYNMAPSIIESLILVLNNKLILENQKISDGKQYFTITKELKKSTYYGI